MSSYKQGDPIFVLKGKSERSLRIDRSTYKKLLDGKSIRYLDRHGLRPTTLRLKKTSPPLAFDAAETVIHPLPLSHVDGNKRRKVLGTGFSHSGIKRKCEWDYHFDHLYSSLTSSGLGSVKIMSALFRTVHFQTIRKLLKKKGFTSPLVLLKRRRNTKFVSNFDDYPFRAKIHFLSNQEVVSNFGTTHHFKPFSQHDRDAIIGLRKLSSPKYKNLCMGVDFSPGSEQGLDTNSIPSSATQPPLQPLKRPRIEFCAPSNPDLVSHAVAVCGSDVPSVQLRGCGGVHNPHKQ